MPLYTSAFIAVCAGIASGYVVCALQLTNISAHIICLARRVLWFDGVKPETRFDVFDILREKHPLALEYVLCAMCLVTWPALSLHVVFAFLSNMPGIHCVLTAGIAPAVALATRWLLGTALQGATRQIDLQEELCLDDD